MNGIVRWLRLAILPEIVRRAARTAVIVGSILTAINHGGEIGSGTLTRHGLLQICLTIMKFLPVPRLALNILLIFCVVGFLTSQMIAGPATTAQIANISTRIRCEKRDAVVVTEFAVQGTGTKYVILRALGPTLGHNGVKHARTEEALVSVLSLLEQACEVAE